MASGEGNELDYEQLESPPDLDEETQASLCTESKTIEVPVADKTLKIYTEQVCKNGITPSLDVLFLHGMRFSSKNWLEIKSVYHVANWGYRAVAVDLPGYGKSTNTLEAEHNADFLKSLISVLGLNCPVIVSPSMSGGFSLPFLFGDPSTSTERSLGYVPVAPVLTSKYVSEFKNSQLPTLIVVGTSDTVNGKESTEDLQNLPRHQYAPIKGATHPCYLDNPDAFHKLFYYFLNQLKP